MVLWSVLGSLLWVTSPRAASEDDPGPLPWRVGGKLGFTVDAAAFPDSIGYQLEVYVRIPPATLGGLAHEEGERSRLKLSVRLRNRFGAAHHDAAQEFAVAPGDTGAGFGKVVMFRFPVRSGVYGMQVKLEDLKSRKRGLAYLGRRVTESASEEGEVTVPSPLQGRRISDLEFVWGEAGPRAALVFRRGPGSALGLLPNPERLYGLLAEELKVQFLVHAPQDPSRPWRWKASIFDTSGRVVAQRESTSAAGPWLVQDLAIGIATEPAGDYDLEIQAWQEGDEEPIGRRSRFSIAWELASWRRNPRDVEDDIHFLLEPDDEKAFARMSPGEQEGYMRRFWRERDPSPGTAENEARDEFVRRVNHANRLWSRAGLGKGMFSDMGRVYIRHGEPDEILRQVIPAGDQTLLQLLQQIEVTEDRSTGEVRTKGLGGDLRPFEVWIYERERTLRPMAKPGDTANPRSRRRLLFLFVDEYGIGEYRLRYSTE